MERKRRLLLTVFQSCLSRKHLVLVIDDVWHTQQLSRLELATNSDSSVLVTSRHALPAGWLTYQGFQLTPDTHKIEQEAIIASYVSGQPEETTVKPHLQVCDEEVCANSPC